MRADKSDITRAFDDLDQLQASHILSFDHELLPDLEQQCQERKLAIRRLAEKIKGMIGNMDQQVLDETGETEECILFFRDRISGLLSQNQTLKKKVHHHREGIENSMKKIQAGKTMLHSYSSPGLKLNRPKVISLTE